MKRPSFKGLPSAAQGLLGQNIYYAASLSVGVAFPAWPQTVLLTFENSAFIPMTHALPRNYSLIVIKGAFSGGNRTREIAVTIRLPLWLCYRVHVG